MNFHQYNTPDMVAIGLSDFLVEALAEGGSTPFHLALSLPTTAPVLAKVWTAEPYRSKIDWGRIHFHLLHETIGATDESHRAVIQREILEPLAIADDHIHAADPASADAAKACTALVDEIARTAPHIGAYPQYDLSIVEVGTDGRIAGVYPNDLDSYISDAPFVVTHYRPDTGAEQSLVTVTLSTLEESRRLVYLALGPDVRYTIGHIVNLFPQAKDYPANFLAAKCPWTHLFADDQAMREKSYSIY